MLVFVLAAPPCGRNHRKLTKPGWEPIQGCADGVGSYNLHCTFKSHVIFTKLARLIRERVTKGRGSLKMGGWCTCFCASSAPMRQKTRKTIKTWLGTYPGMGWWGGFIKFALYIQNPCHFHETSQTYRERVPKGRGSLKMGGWCARFCASSAPKRQKTSKTHKTWSGTYPDMS